MKDKTYRVVCTSTTTINWAFAVKNSCQSYWTVFYINHLFELIVCLIQHIHAAWLIHYSLGTGWLCCFVWWHWQEPSLFFVFFYIEKLVQNAFSVWQSFRKVLWKLFVDISYVCQNSSNLWWWPNVSSLVSAFVVVEALGQVEASTPNGKGQSIKEKTKMKFYACTNNKDKECGFSY